jgi:hypothetical protein
MLNTAGDQNQGMAQTFEDACGYSIVHYAPINLAQAQRNRNGHLQWE